MTFTISDRAGKTIGSWGIAVGLLLSGCTIPASETVQPLPTEGREDLINGTTTSTTILDVSDEDVDVRLYFIGANEELERVVRPFPRETKTGVVLDALVQGPLPEEELTSRITENLAPTPVGGVDAAGRQTIRVSSEADLRSLVDQDPARARRIVSQIVCTVVDLREDILSVRIVDETDDPIEVPDADSKLIEGPARASDFNDCKTGRDILEEQIESEQNESTTTDS